MEASGQHFRKRTMYVIQPLPMKKRKKDISNIISQGMRKHHKNRSSSQKAATSLNHSKGTKKVHTSRSSKDKGTISQKLSQIQRQAHSNRPADVKYNISQKLRQAHSNRPADVKYNISQKLRQAHSDRPADVKYNISQKLSQIQRQAHIDRPADVKYDISQNLSQIQRQTHSNRPVNEKAAINAKVSASLTATLARPLSPNENDIRERNRAAGVERARETRQRNRENDERQISLLGFKNHFDKKLEAKKKDNAKSYRKTLNTFRTDRYDVSNHKHSCGDFNNVCHHCGALHFQLETIGKWCCGEGVIHKLIPKLTPLPEFLVNLLKEQPRVISNILSYNAQFAMCSIGAAAKSKILSTNQTFMPFKVQGSIYHSIYPIQENSPVDGKMGLGMYFIDGDQLELHLKEKCSEKIEKKILDCTALLQMAAYIREKNPYVKMYQSVNSYMTETNNSDVVVQDFNVSFIKDKGAYEAPSNLHQQIAIVPFADATCSTGFRDIQVAGKSSTPHNGWRTIDELSPHYDPLYYVLLFPDGDEGYDFTKKPHKTQRKRGETAYSLLAHYRYRLMIRKNDKHDLKLFNKLYQRYVVDQAIKIDNNNLKYVANNKQTQKNIAKYSELRDTVRTKPSEIGHIKPGVMPASHIGSEKHFRQLYYNVLHLTSEIGYPPTLFITMTANPKWPEIVAQLKKGQHAYDHPDIVSRVFKMKLDALIKDLTKDMALGGCVARVHVIEFQKRGLPHAHIIIWLEKKDIPQTEKEWEQIVCAELPPQGDPLRELIGGNMVHGPCCDKRCLENGKCKKGFPQQLLEESEFDEHGIIQIKRPKLDPSKGFRKKVRVDKVMKEIIFLNCDVVQYNPALCRKYWCHINVVPVRNSMSALKYLYGYNLKGADAGTIVFLDKDNNEFDRHISGRVTTPPSACWSIFSYPMSCIYPPVQDVYLHLPNEQPVTIPHDATKEQLEKLKRAPPTSQLMGFFNLNAMRFNGLDNEAEKTNDLYYEDVSSYYTWHAEKEQWNQRINIPAHQTLTRMTWYDSSCGELFFLRLLLKNIPNPTSFDELKVDPRDSNVVYPSFREACRQRNLLDDDTIWIVTLDNAAMCYKASVIRLIFATLLANEEVTDVKSLYLKYLDVMVDDLTYKIDNYNVHQKGLHEKQFTINQLKEQFLARELTHLLQSMDSNKDSLMWHPDIPQLDNSFNPIQMEVANTTNETSSYYINNEKNNYLSSLNLINASKNNEQFNFVQSFCNNYNMNNHLIYLLMAGAGTGKTFCANCIISYVRQKEKDADAVICVSSSALGADLLRSPSSTVHSRFRFKPVTPDEKTFCPIKTFEPAAIILLKAKLLVFEEALSNHKELARAISDLLKRLHQNDKPFGGISIVFLGDNRQAAPIIPGGTRSEIASSTILSLPEVRSKARTVTLSKIMRLEKDENDPNMADFSKFQMEVGNGTRKTNKNGCIDIPAYIPRARKPEDLAKFVYPELLQSKDSFNLTDEQLSNRLIVAPTNKLAQEMNSIIVEQFESSKSRKIHIYKSHDFEGIMRQDNSPSVPVEELNRTNPSQFPPHELKLYPGMPIIAIRKICGQIPNGTRLRVLKLQEHLIEARVITGKHKNKVVYIPRQTVQTTPEQYPFILRRKQFPILPAYALTIDKSQGQTVETLGVFLKRQVFSHGQLYVAISRCKHYKKLCILSGAVGERDEMRNIVFRELLAQSGQLYELENKWKIDA